MEKENITFFNIRKNLFRFNKLCIILMTNFTINTIKKRIEKFVVSVNYVSLFKKCPLIISQNF